MSRPTSLVEAILYNWSDSEWQRSMVAPDKFSTISFIHDNYTYLLNSDSVCTEKNEYHIFFLTSDLVYAFSSKCPLFLK